MIALRFLRGLLKGTAWGFGLIVLLIVIGYLFHG